MTQMTSKQFATSPHSVGHNNNNHHHHGHNDDIPDIDVDEALPNLFERIYPALHPDGHEVVSRILLGGQIHSHDEPVRNFFEDVLHSGDVFTQLKGVYAEYSDSFMHLLEGPAEVILKFLVEVEGKMTRDGFEGTKTIFIMSYTDDVEEMYFSKWYLFDWTQLSQPATLQGHKTLEYHIVDAIFGLCTIGKALSTQSKAQEVIFINNMKSTHEKHIPRGSVLVETALKSENCLTLSEFNQVFAVPVDLTLQGEVIWPVEPPLKY